MKVKCIAIDDEPLALEQIERYIKQTPFLEFLGSFPSALKALDHDFFKETQLIYLDINMPDLNGLDFSKHVSHDKKVIFTTAYEQYALEGFKADALDYLLKPFSYDEFLKATLKAKDFFELVEKANSTELQIDHIFVKSEYQSIRVNLEDVFYVESMKDYVKIFLKSRTKPIFTLMKISSMEDKLPSSNFMRVHRSFIVALNKIESVERNSLVINNNPIPVGESYKQQFGEYIKKGLI